MPKWQTVGEEAYDDYFTYVDGDNEEGDEGEEGEENKGEEEVGSDASKRKAPASMFLLKNAVDKDKTLGEAKREWLDSWVPTEPYSGRCKWSSNNHTQVLTKNLEVQAKWMRREDDGPKRYYMAKQSSIWIREILGKLLGKKTSFKPLPSGEMRDKKRTATFTDEISV